MKTLTYGVIILFCSVGCEMNEMSSGNGNGKIISKIKSKNILESQEVAPQKITPAKVTLTKAAASEVRDVIKSASLSKSTYLTVAVIQTPLSCSGYRYRLHFKEDFPEDQYLFSKSQGIPVAVKKDSMKFLKGTTIDYTTSISGKSGFLFNNPNAKNSSSDSSSSDN